MCARALLLNAFPSVFTFPDRVASLCLILISSRFRLDNNVWCVLCAAHGDEWVRRRGRSLARSTHSHNNNTIHLRGMKKIEPFISVAPSPCARKYSKFLMSAPGALVLHSVPSVPHIFVRPFCASHMCMRCALAPRHRQWEATSSANCLEENK